MYLKIFFFIVPSILTFDFDLIFGLFFLIFEAIMGCFGARGKVEKVF